MTRKEAAEKLKSLWYFLINNDYPQKDLDALKVAIKTLEQEPKTEWTPVSERLPEDGEEVLCFLESEEMAVLFRRNNWGEYEWVDGGFATGSYDVIAWMPIEPYKAESEGKE